MRNLLRRGLSAALFLLLFVASAVQAQTIYVDADATGANNGTSWANAYTSLQTALTGATSGAQIWVAQGTYSPGNTRTNTFTIGTGITVIGGFAGTEASPANRAVNYHAVSPTILDGDYDNNSASSFGDLTANYSVVTFNGNGTLDGFIVTGGNDDRAPSNTNANGVGGGIKVNGGLGIPQIAPTIRNSVLRGNSSAANGASIGSVNAGYNLINVLITESGGATTAASVVAAAAGRTNFLADDPAVDFPIFMDNVTIAGNGGQTFIDSEAIASVTLVAENSIFYGNALDLPAGSSTFQETEATLTNVVFDQQASFCVVGGITCSNVTGTNPNLRTSDTFYSLQSSSTSALDQGNSALIPAGVTEDGAKRARIQGAAVDLGWVEGTDAVAAAGPVANITVAPTSLNFGSVTVNTSSTLMVEITNTGAAPLLVDPASITGTDAALFSTSLTAAQTIAPGAMLDIDVIFAPTSLGAKTATLNIPSNDPDTPSLAVPLSGTVVAAPVQDIDVNPASQDFGTVAPGSTASRTVVVSNVGSIALEVTSTTISGANAALFVIDSGAGPFTLAPGATRDIVIDFSPAAEGSFSASLTIASDDPDEASVVVALSGVSSFAPPLAVVPQVAQTDGGDLLLIDIVAGSATSPVANLFGVGAKLNFDPSLFEAESIVKGALLGNDVIVFSDIDNASGVISWTVTRIAPASNVTNAVGVVAVIGLRVKEFITPGSGDALPRTFTLSDIQATTAAAELFTLSPVAGTVTVIDRVEVFPGDTNDHGVVDANDIFPVGDCFGVPTNPRSEVDIKFEPKDGIPSAFPNPVAGETCVVASTPNPVFADADGNGQINQNDILAVGVNFGRNQTEFPATKLVPVEGKEEPKVATASKNATMELARLRLDPRTAGENYVVEVVLGSAASPVDSLFGVAMELQLPKDMFRVRAVRSGMLLNNGDLLSFERFNAETGVLSASFTRKRGAEAAAGHGAVATILLEVSKHMTQPVEVVLASANLNVYAAGVKPANEGEVSLQISTTAVGTEDEPEAIPQEFALAQAYPNPFNPQTTISYALAEAVAVRLVVFDMLGRSVATLVDAEQQPAGRYELRFDAGNLPSGTYFYQLQAGSFSKTGTMQLIK